MNARGHAFFFGAHDKDAKPIVVAERFMKLMPAAREALPAGDFRDWAEIEAWAARSRLTCAQAGADAGPGRR